MKKKIALAAAAIVALSLIAFLILRREVQPIDAHLAVDVPALARDENAFFLLLTVAQKISLDQTEERHLNQSLKDEYGFPELEELFLERFAQPLAQLPNILAVSNLVLRFSTNRSSEFSAISEFALLQSLRPRRLAETGRMDEAYAIALSLIDLGHRIEGGGGATVDYSLGVRIKSRGLREIRRMVGTEPGSVARLNEVLEKLDQFRGNSTFVTNAIKAQYHEILDYLRFVESGSFASTPGEIFAYRMAIPLGFSLPKTQRLLIYKTETVLSHVGETYQNSSLQLRATLGSQKPDAAKSILDGNVLGKFLIDGLTQDGTTFFAKVCREEAEFNATTILIAASAFEKTHGRRPDSPEELAPAFLARYPKDPFDGAPMRFTPGFQIIYSIGPDLLDSGGKSTNASGKTLDYPFNTDVRDLK